MSSPHSSYRNRDLGLYSLENCRNAKAASECLVGCSKWIVRNFFELCSQEEVAP